MSADLFAEFNSLSSNSPPPPPAQKVTPFLPQAQQKPAPPAQPTQQTGAKDPFDFFNNTSHASPVNTQPWPAFQTQPTPPSNVWASAPAPSKPTGAVEDDDDGWGDFEVAEPSKPSATNPAPLQVSSPAPSSIPAWGSTTATGLTNSSSIPWNNPSPAPAPAPALAQPVPAVRQQPPTRIVRASTLDLMSNSLVDIDALKQPSSGASKGHQSVIQSQLRQQWEQQPNLQESQQPRMKAKLKPSATNDPSILFDAEDFELQVAEGDDDDDDDDEFGDFETVAPPPAAPEPKVAHTAAAPTKAAPTLPSVDLLSLDEPQPEPASSRPTRKQPPSQLLGPLAFGATASNYPQAPKSPSFQDRNPFPDLAIKTPTTTEPKEIKKPKEASPVTAWPALESTVDAKEGKGREDDDDEWGAWDDFPANESKKTGIESSKPPESWDWDAVDNVQPSQSNLHEDVPPPINVPPPSVILSAFPDLLNSGNALFKPMSGQNSSIKQRILSDPKAVDFLEGYVLLAVTAARVIAGRKQRWHRDKILAKSMSISAAGSKGMKLAGVDKTQSAREDREAADVVAAWRQQVGRLRSAVAAAKAAGKGPPLRVPEISENMPVQTAKMVPTAPKACIICGLKREERVAKVDYEVEDSFGEWWVDHWGHKACKNFWIEHEQKLRQR
ncbi:hypothetical protein FALBO_14047 [Fusarium albosuccineum]|uniref:Serine/threonine-protein kinase ppk6 n=1 Tax=Fusarium albosuccineum TaxID=1237068 RepID=A0A8H4PFX5_9HYPO|nr:hypothetical protein FALBO_14047 [Fusarium albosuccineum]